MPERASISTLTPTARDGISSRGRYRSEFYRIAAKLSGLPYTGYLGYLFQKEYQ